MSVSYDRLAERIDDLILELSLINSELIKDNSKIKSSILSANLS